MNSFIFVYLKESWLQICFKRHLCWLGTLAGRVSFQELKMQASPCLGCLRQLQRSVLCHSAWKAPLPGAALPPSSPGLVSSILMLMSLGFSSALRSGQPFLAVGLRSQPSPLGKLWPFFLRRFLLSPPVYLLLRAPGSACAGSAGSRCPLPPALLLPWDGRYRRQAWCSLLPQHAFNPICPPRRRH